MYGYLHEFIFDLRGLSRTIARAGPDSLDWAVHKLERIDRILQRRGIRSEQETLGVEPVGGGPDGTPEFDDTIPLYYFDHVCKSADSTLEWSLVLYGYEKKPVEAEVRLRWYQRNAAHGVDALKESLRGTRRQWFLSRSPDWTEVRVSKRRAFEIVDRMAEWMAALKGIQKLR